MATGYAKLVMVGIMALAKPLLVAVAEPEEVLGVALAVLTSKSM